MSLLQFVVHDVYKAREMILAKGGSISIEPYSVGDLAVVMFVLGPDGIPSNLVQQCSQGWLTRVVGSQPIHRSSLSPLSTPSARFRSFGAATCLGRDRKPTRPKIKKPVANLGKRLG